MAYTLEVCRRVPMGNGCKYIHVGYMRAIFKSKNAACEYYSRHNPHMRRMFAVSKGAFYSESDPVTELMYVVREKHHLIEAIFPPFNPADAPVEKDGVALYKYLE